MPEQNAPEMFVEVASPDDGMDDFDYDEEHVELISVIKEYSYGEDDEELMEEEITSVTVTETAASAEPAEPAPSSEEVPAETPAPAAAPP